MRQTTRALIAIALTVSFFSATANVVAADEADDYREAMEPFTADLARWADGLTTVSNAAVGKPELACTEDYAELARIGGWMADDLHGMADNDLVLHETAAAHELLLSSLETMTDAATNACGDSAAAAEIITAQKVDYDLAINAIRLVISGSFGPMGW